VREDNCGGSSGILGLCPSQPPDLGDGHRCDWYRTNGIRPNRRPTQFGDQIIRIGRGPVVIPQQSIAYQLTVVVQSYHAVLLAADGERGHTIEEGRIGCRLLVCR
jgi:hypothetical protein